MNPARLLSIPAVIIEEPYISVVSTIEQDEVKGEETEECFGDEDQFYVDEDIKRIRIKHQPNTPRSLVSACRVASRGWTFDKAFKALPNAPQTNDIIETGEWLIHEQYTSTFTQIKDLFERKKHGEALEFRMNGHGNLFPVETGDVKNPVRVCHFNFLDGIGDVFLYDIDADIHWGTRELLFVRNLGVSKF